MSNEIPSIHHRHPNVGQHEVRQKPFRFRQALFSVVRSANRKPLFLEHARNRVEHQGFVINDQDSFAFIHGKMQDWPPTILSRNAAG